MPWLKWRARLAGEKVETFLQPDAADEGYYRKPNKERLPNGQWRTLGYEPVAIFVRGKSMTESMLCAVIGSGDKRRALAPEQIEDVWQWCCAHPISEETYRAVAERGEPWPDMVAPEPLAEAPAADRTVTVADNAEPKKPLHVVLGEKIDAAIKAFTGLKVTNDDEAAQAQGAANRLNELKLEAEKAGKALYEPPYREYKRLYAIWSPLAKRPEEAAKKLNAEVLGHEKRKREAAAKVAAERARLEQEEADRLQRDADRAILNGDVAASEVMPVHTIALPPLDLSPAEAPKAQVKATYGRARAIREKKVAVIEDIAAVFALYRDRHEVVAVLTKLAQADIDAGLTVPGVRIDTDVV